MKKILLSLMMVLGAMSMSAKEFILSPSAVTTIDPANADVNQYNAEATSWAISQGTISGTSLKNYSLKYLLFQFDLKDLEGWTIQKAEMSYDSKCTVSGKNSNVVLASVNSAWDVATVTWNSLNADAKAVQVSSGTGQNVKTSTVNLKENVLNFVKDSVATTASKKVAFVIYTYTAREQQISNIKLTIEAIDADASVNVNIKYMCNGTEVKSATTIGTKDQIVELSSAEKANFFVGDKKYIYVSDNSAEVTAAEGAEVIVQVREAAVYTYSLVSSLGGVVASGSNFEGESINAGYPKYQLNGTDLAVSAATNKEYRKSFTLDSDNKEVDVTYAASKENVVFYSEAENIDGLTEVTYGNVAIRASNARAAKATVDTKITTLEAGKYIINAGVFSSAKSPAYVIKIAAGETTYEAPVTAVNASEVASSEISLTKATDITLLAEGMTDNNALDYIYIQKTGEAEPAAPAVADFENINIEGESVKYFEDENPAENPVKTWTSGDYTFSTYTSDWGSSGKYYYSYAVSNKTTTGGKLNDYALESACGGAKNGSNYAVWYDNTWNGGDAIVLKEPAVVSGFYVTNTTSTVDAILNGDGISPEKDKTTGQPFGYNGDDDVFTLVVTGYDADSKETGKVEFKMAYTEDGKIYYAKDWKWVNLTTLGKVASIKTTMTSTKKNSWGATTPLYFCMDDFGGVAPEVDAEYATESIATAIINVEAANVQKVGKFIQNGRVIIVKNGKAYTTSGALIK